MAKSNPTPPTQASPFGGTPKGSVGGFKEAAGRDFAPIIQLEEGEFVVAAVLEIRKETGQFNSAVVDLATLDGVEFSLNGHAILVDKIESQLVEDRRIFNIIRGGMIGRAKDYAVAMWDGDEASFHAWPESAALIQATNATVEAKLAAIPPRD